MILRTLFWGIAVVIILGLFAAYSGTITTNQKTQPAAPAQQAGIANPASVHCVEVGGTLEIVTESGGGQAGYCHMKDGSVCEEWTLFRSGDCVAPAQQ